MHSMNSCARFRAATTRCAGTRAPCIFKGRIQGKNLLTLRYDTQSDKENERLFRDIQPDEFYPVYGDSSLKGFDAQSTSRLYVRVDRDRSYVLYGDYSTTPRRRLARSLGEYKRSLTGVKTHHRKRQVVVQRLCQPRQRHANRRRNSRQGFSGPYLLRNVCCARKAKTSKSLCATAISRVADSASHAANALQRLSHWTV